LEALFHNKMTLWGTSQVRTQNQSIILEAQLYNQLVKFKVVYLIVYKFETFQLKAA